MAAIGDVDETNSAIGVAIGRRWAPASISRCSRASRTTCSISAPISPPRFGIEDALRIVPAQVEWLEERIDAMNGALEPLTSFILPAGEPAAAALHLARAIARRAERTTVAAAAQVAFNPPERWCLSQSAVRPAVRRSARNEPERGRRRSMGPACASR
jgi:cob(I)alamin adenosyltransferase